MERRAHDNVSGVDQLFGPFDGVGLRRGVAPFTYYPHATLETSWPRHGS